jgi:cytochrome c oxidase subunit IV
MGGHSADDIAKHVKTYILVFVALMILTFVTVWVTTLGLSITAGIIVAMIVASAKGSLVGGFFMHLTSERAIIYCVLAMTAAFFAMLMLVPVLDSTSNMNIGKW